ncbi:MAG TPA: hypothetical protein VN429_07125 [Methanospirillum sp.]|uniref:hypothetical protein n=1 Tax=Methanospirillum sp. TaxID=45200 RepID=UPI002B6A655A|nr:hypothetical protein [Methanospirillum sp.]HWQ64173.1 hypothetical protein [Methanospirillum sp.]
MKKGYLVAGLFCLLCAALTGADFIATTISTDGSAHLSTSGSDANGSFAQHAMTVDASRLIRTVSGDETGNDMVVSGSGPVLVSDFASAIVKGSEIRDHCMFLDAGVERSLGDASVYVSGILREGEYDSSRAIGSGLSGETRVNGSGLLAFGFQGTGNRSMESRGFVSGNMSVQDLFRYGGRV